MLTAIITTRNRVDACARAVASALEQDPPPLEVIVCDDGSTDGTRDRLEAWAAREPRLRYVRAEAARGGPGPGRNDGLRLARGAWVAFLDDDDAWLPGKLRAQLAAAEAGDADVIGTNALRSDGSVYFPALRAPHRPDRRELVRHNPLVVSSVAVRTELLRAAGGFDERVWMGGIADYDAWLRLADAGARLLVLPEPLVRYEDAGEDRYSAARLEMQRRLARHGWARWWKRRGDRTALESALRRTTDLGLVAAERLRGRF